MRSDLGKAAAGGAPAIRNALTRHECAFLMARANETLTVDGADVPAIGGLVCVSEASGADIAAKRFLTRAKWARASAQWRLSHAQR